MSSTLSPPRPPMPAGRARLAAALLESSFLLALGSLFVTGLIDEGSESLDSHWPIRLGVRALPMLIVIGAHAVQRLLRSRSHAFMMAGALVASTGALMAPDLSALQRLGHTAGGLLVGAIVTWWFAPLDDESERLLTATAWTGRELFFAACLVMVGSMPAMIAGGLVLVIPSMLVALLIIGRNLRFELSTLRHGDRGRPGALVRLLLGLVLGLTALSLMLVGSMMSLGLGPRERERGAPATSSTR